MTIDKNDISASIHLIYPANSPLVVQPDQEYGPEVQVLEGDVIEHADSIRDQIATYMWVGMVNRVIVLGSNSRVLSRTGDGKCCQG